MEMEINGRQIFVCSFIGAILGDMPSQQLLSGCLGPRANRSCRYCLTTKDELSNLGYHIVEFGRYSEQLRRDFNRVRAIPSKVARQKALKDLGLHNKWDLKVLDSLFPCLDPRQSRPVDAAHSEYQSIAKTLYALIFDEPGIFTQTALEDFSKVFNTFPFPPGWKQLQSPTRHLLSWRMRVRSRRNYSPHHIPSLAQEEPYQEGHAGFIGATCP